MKKLPMKKCSAILCLSLAACQTPVAGGDFCKVYEAAVRGELKLTEAEARSLRRITALDLRRLKLHYRDNCQGD